MAITKASSSAVAPAAKGDLVVGSATNDSSVLAVGTTDQVLTADSSTATGLKWATASAGGMTLLASGSIDAGSVGFDLTSISGSYNELWLYLDNYSLTSAGVVELYTNNNTAANYYSTYLGTNDASPSYSPTNTAIRLISAVSASVTGNSAIVRIPNYTNTTAFKHFEWRATRTTDYFWWGTGYTSSKSAIDRITLTCANTFDAGTYKLFGVK